MRKIFLLLISTVVFSSVCYGKTSVDNSSEYKIKGAQVFVFDKIYENNLDNFFSEISKKGINTVFVRMFHNSGDRAHFHKKEKCKSGVYFQTKHACVIDNILPSVISAGHKYNIKVYGWMATRSLSFLKTKDNLSLSLDTSGKNVEGYGANIFKKDVREKIILLFEDLAKNNIDGILFQDDFIIKYSEGIDNFSSSLFEKETGLKVSADNFFTGKKNYNGRQIFTGYKDDFYVWAEWKSRHMSYLFGEIRERVKNINPKIKMAVNIYYETPLDKKTGLAWYSQNIELLKNYGADYFAVMGYSEQISKEQNKNINLTANIISRIADNAVKNAGSEERVIMKLQTKSFYGKGRLSEKDYNIVCSKLKKYKNISTADVPVFNSNDIYNCQ